MIKKLKCEDGIIAIKLWLFGKSTTAGKNVNSLNVKDIEYFIKNIFTYN